MSRLPYAERYMNNSTFVALCQRNYVRKPVTVSRMFRAINRYHLSYARPFPRGQESQAGNQ